MMTINSSDVVKKPSFITNPKEITFVEDAKKHITKSVILPFALYERLREKIEDEIYLYENQAALSQTVYDEFLEVDEAGSEDLAK